MNKREAVLSLLDETRTPETIPAAFFLHFDPAFHRGQAAIDKHLEYFRHTGMDFVKIQYENKFPHLAEIRNPEDWAKMPSYALDFYKEQLFVVEGLVKAAKRDALVIQTLYSPFMCAGHSTSLEMVTDHIKENPEKVKPGMEAITDSLMRFVKECIRLGVDGFYTSTQGGEYGVFEDITLFNECVRPYDLRLMEEINSLCPFNILHICDYHKKYADLARFRDYPGQIVNCSLELVFGTISAREVSKIFNRPFMGGMDRLGVLATGCKDDVSKAAKTALENAPERFILGADCTVPNDTPWENLRTAISTAHSASL